MNNKLHLAIILVLPFSCVVHATEWVKTYNMGGSTGTITFDDWGYVGAGGRNATEFDPINGFGGPLEGNALDANGGIGQLQHVITNAPDWLTPDASQTLYEDGTSGTAVYLNVNMDSQTNFFRWGYTSPAGSTFSNMQIDYDGDYHVAQNDMSFNMYETLIYNDDSGAELIYLNTNFAFQPYVVSDAKGWCGSIMASHPNAIEPMAGQLTFDVVFDVYFQDPVTKELSFSNSEIIPNFEMRSWGDLVVDLVRYGTPQQYTSRAVVNNTNPVTIGGLVNPNVLTLEADSNYHNTVSFHGADVIPPGGACGIETPEWIAGERGIGIKHFSGLINAENSTACGEAGGTWSNNAFGGFAFLLRADATRYIDWFDESRYGPDPTIDPDGDGVMNYLDNCALVANADQLDSDGDNYGNACDGDFNNDNLVNSQDLGMFKQMFLSTGDVEADLNSDQIVNSQDIGLFKALFLKPVGPSGTAQ